VYDVTIPLPFKLEPMRTQGKKCDCRDTYRSKLILVGVYSLYDLSIDEIVGYIIEFNIMPRREDLFAVM